MTCRHVPTCPHVNTSGTHKAYKRLWGIGKIQGFQAEPAVAADGAGITACPGMKSLRPARLLA